VWPDSIWLRKGWLMSAAAASARIDSFFAVRAARSCRPSDWPMSASSTASAVAGAAVVGS